jgi:ribosome biogenesis protein ENP2
MTVGGSVCWRVLIFLPGADMRRRIELIQDFEMPDVSTCICMSPDGQYIFVGGTYKPRLRCYDVHEMSMKFERCVDAEIIKMLVLSDGYEKVGVQVAYVYTAVCSQLALLQDERYIELHVQHGAHLRLRLPKFGRDIAYYAPHAELLVCASGGDIYRLNLELGRFMQPMNSEALSTTCCAVNQHHYLFVNGTNDVCGVHARVTMCTVST